MRYILLLFFIATVGNHCLAQSITGEELPYNTKPHSVKEHCKTISGCYALLFSLPRKERISLYKDLRQFYFNKGVGNVLPNDLHAFIHSRMKNCLTVNQFEYFEKMNNYYEFVFSKGAPIASTYKTYKTF